MSKISPKSWNTYAMSGYTHQVGSDARATGGVHLHQVRRGAKGWMRRIMESNGCHSSPGPVESVTDQEGAVLWQRALDY